MLALTPLSAAVMGGRQSAITELLKLVRSLGGHIFAPGLETYADRLNITGPESTLNSQVGYIGNAAGADYAYQDTLANTPKLVALGNARGLEFDGSTDHLVTDITTPSSGYMLSVFRQDEAIGANNALIGCGSTTNIVAGITLQNKSTGVVRLNRIDASGSFTSAETTASIVVGTATIADSSWTATSAKVRLNGVAEGVDAVTRDPTGTGVLLIGAQNQAKDGALSPGNYMQGAFGIQIIIPNVTLSADTEQRIRKLVGQIYGVQTQ